MLFRGIVDESEIGRLREGMKAEIVVAALADAVFPGELTYISPKKRVTPNTPTGTGTTEFELEATFERKADVVLRAGYSANANIVLEKRTQVLAINEAFVEFKDDKAFVLVQSGKSKGDKNPDAEKDQAEDIPTERVEIETGISDGINIEVVSDLDPDAVIQNHQKADEGVEGASVVAMAVSSRVAPGPPMATPVRGTEPGDARGVSDARSPHEEQAQPVRHPVGGGCEEFRPSPRGPGKGRQGANGKFGS